MRNSSKLEVIGELACDCGRVAYVEQTKRKGDFVQVRCSACGVDQRVGKTLQARWKDTMQPIGHYQDSKTVAPFGAADVAIVSNSVPDTNTDTIGDSKTDTIPEPVKTAPKAEPVRREVIKTNKKSATFSPLFGLGVFVVSIGSAAILSELSKGMRG
ncbi:hypothetical protein [Marinomonas foliarum]|uniref:Uncharacterized protein n=2 Tax=root TaxID=1 RepID=A0A899ISR1_9VIRU|nr:hypothetical protein [Marinomonas foliarum]QRV22791.1 hypothetical protein JSY38_12005 [Marinomonas foliarum]QSM01486.1 hypothetical protein [Marinomonas phage MfV]